MKPPTASATLRVVLTTGFFAVFSGIAPAQESAPVASRPTSAPAADDPADVERICDLYEEARAAVEEGDWESAAEIAATADAERSKRLLHVHAQVASALNQFAFRLQRTGHSVEALPRYEAALSMRRRLFEGDHPDVVLSLRNLASCLEAVGRPGEALPLHEEALGMCRALFNGADADVALCLNNYATCLHTLGRTEEALALFDETLAMQRRLSDRDRRETAITLVNIATCRLGLGRVREALSPSEAALAMQRRLWKDRDHAEVAGCIAIVARCLNALGRHEESLTRQEEALAMLRRLFSGDHPDVASSLNNVAVGLAQVGRTEAALTNHRAALAMWRGLGAGDHPNVAIGLHNVAVCLQDLGRPGEALPEYEAALAMWRRLFPGDHSDVASGLNGVGYCLGALGRLQDALTRYEAALTMRRRLFKGDHPDVAVSINNVASVLRLLGREEEALLQCVAAVEMRRRLFSGDHADLAISLDALAVCLEALGRPGEAMTHYREGLEMRRRMFPGDHADVAISLHNLGHCLGVLGRAAEARPLYEAAIAMGRNVRVPELSDFLRNAAELSAQAGDLVGAAAQLAEAAGLYESRRRDVLRVGSGTRGVYERALGAREVYADLSRVRIRLGDLAGAAEAAERGRSRAALDLLTRSKIEPLSEARRRALRDDDLSTLRRIDDVTRALDAAEREFVRQQRAEAAAELRTDRDEAERRSDALKYSAAMSQVRATLDAADAERAQLIADVLPLGRPATIDEARKLVTGRERLLLYFVGMRGSRLFFVRPTGEEIGVRDLTGPDGEAVTAPRLAAVVASYCSQLSAAGRAVPDRGVDDPVGNLGVSAGSDGSTAALGRRLFDMLMPPELWAEVRDAGRIVLMPDGALHRLPFEALIVEAGKSTADRTYWLDVGPEIVYASSAATNLECRRLHDARRSATTEHAVLAIGDPRFTNDDGAASRAAPVAVGASAVRAAVGSAGSAVLTRPARLEALPGTRREVESVRLSIEGRPDARQRALKVKTLLGADATEANVFAAAPTARILHFATHHLVEETENASFSALALTAPLVPGGDDDGFLRVHDLLERWGGRLPATDLVVLSACESKGGDNVLDESIIAMPTAFLFAGVPSVVASLWRVDDQATADLMADFYRRLFDPAANAATADRPAPTRLEHFTAARKAARARRPEPYFWAPFVWMGDPR